MPNLSSPSVTSLVLGASALATLATLRTCILRGETSAAAAKAPASGVAAAAAANKKAFKEAMAEMPLIAILRGIEPKQVRKSAITTAASSSTHRSSVRSTVPDGALRVATLCQ